MKRYWWLILHAKNTKGQFLDRNSCTRFFQSPREIPFTENKTGFILIYICHMPTISLDQLWKPRTNVGFKTELHTFLKAAKTTWNQRGSPGKRNVNLYIKRKESAELPYGWLPHDLKKEKKKRRTSSCHVPNRACIKDHWPSQYRREMQFQQSPPQALKIGPMVLLTPQLFLIPLYKESWL